MNENDRPNTEATQLNIENTPKVIQANETRGKGRTRILPTAFLGIGMALFIGASPIFADLTPTVTTATATKTATKTATSTETPEICEARTPGYWKGIPHTAELQSALGKLSEIYNFWGALTPVQARNMLDVNAVEMEKKLNAFALDNALNVVAGYIPANGVYQGSVDFLRGKTVDQIIREASPLINNRVDALEEEYKNALDEIANNKAGVCEPVAPTNTPINTPTSIATPTSTEVVTTPTLVATATSTRTNTPTSVATTIWTATVTASPTATPTSTSTFTVTPRATDTPSPTITGTPVDWRDDLTPMPSPTPEDQEPGDTPIPESTSTPTSTPEAVIEMVTPKASPTFDISKFPRTLPKTGFSRDFNYIPDMGKVRISIPEGIADVKLGPKIQTRPEHNYPLLGGMIFGGVGLATTGAYINRRTAIRSRKVV